MGWVYILKGKNGRYYIGSSNNVERRLEEHNNGESKYTRNLRPMILVFKQQFSNIKLTRQIEYKLKKLKRRDIIEKIIVEGKILMDL